MSNAVNQPAHYNWHPAGIPCIDISELMSANAAAALEYIWRAKHKGNEREDLQKAKFRIEREIQLQEKGKGRTEKAHLPHLFVPISQPFGDLSKCVFRLLVAEFSPYEMHMKLDSLKLALAELNRYLEAMP